MSSVNVAEIKPTPMKSSISTPAKGPTSSIIEVHKFWKEAVRHEKQGLGLSVVRGRYLQEKNLDPLPEEYTSAMGSKVS